MIRRHYIPKLTILAAALALALPAQASLLGGAMRTLDSTLGGSSSASASASVSASAKTSSGQHHHGKAKVEEKQHAKASTFEKTEFRKGMHGVKVDDDAFEKQIHRLSMKEKDFIRAMKSHGKDEKPAREEKSMHEVEKPNKPHMKKPDFHQAKHEKRDVKKPQSGQHGKRNHGGFEKVRFEEKEKTSVSAKARAEESSRLLVAQNR